MPLLKKEIVTQNIINKCNELNVKFIGFVNDEWVGVHTKLVLYCFKHKHTWETSTYENFIRKKYGCPYCGEEKRKEQRWIKESIALDNIEKKCSDKNYEFIGFVGGKWEGGRKTRLIILCHNHNYSWKPTYSTFIIDKRDRGCMLCGYESNIMKQRTCEKIAIKNVVEKCDSLDMKFISFFNNKWIGTHKTRLVLHCNKHDVDWDTVIYHNLVHGKRIPCCPICEQSTMEKYVQLLLEKNNIKFIKNYRNFDWLRNIRPLELDFYLPDYNIAIECQGIQHYTGWGGNEKHLEYLQDNDLMKNLLCKGNFVPIHYIKYNSVENDIENLIKIINNNKL